MNRRRRRPSSPISPATAPPLEDENLLLEILLRLFPLPSSLPRASLVCKRWRRLVSDPKFLRRFRAHHRKAPLLGFFIRCVDGISFKSMLRAPDRIPPSRFCLPQTRHESWDFVGCRHGLALINKTRLEVVVWDPITRHQHCVAFPPGFDERYSIYVRNAALLCASGENHDQVHGDCGLHPYKLVLVQGTDRIGEPQRVLAYLYDSESRVWGNVISAATKHGIHDASPNVLVGNALYWLLNGGEILEFDFQRQSLVVIDRPAAVPPHGEKYDDFQILRTRGNRFGFAMWTEMGIEIWERKGNSDSVARWERQDIIEFDKLPPLVSRERFCIAGFDEDTNAIFLSTYISRTFMVHLESMQFRRISIRPYFQVYPYTNFYTAEELVMEVELKRVTIHQAIFLCPGLAEKGTKRKTQNPPSLLASAAEIRADGVMKILGPGVEQRCSVSDLLQLNRFRVLISCITLKYKKGDVNTVSAWLYDPSLFGDEDSDAAFEVPR